MNIVCPNCSHENTIEYGENIACGECEKTLSGHTYKRFKKPLISATTALFIGAYGAHKIEKEYIAEPRYPVGVEYELIDSCVNSSRSVMASSWRVDKTKICICALKNTMSEVSFKDMKEGESEFLTRFHDNIVGCY